MFNRMKLVCMHYWMLAWAVSLLHVR